jgi:N-terminal acetyltransferase 2
VGVYLVLSVLDFPFCFAAVQFLGAERIGHYEHVIMDAVKKRISWPLGGDWDSSDQGETGNEAGRQTFQGNAMEIVKQGPGGKEEAASTCFLPFMLAVSLFLSHYIFSFLRT